MIFSDRHRSLSFLYIEYVDIPGGPPAGHWNVPQIINQKIIRQLPRKKMLRTETCNNARHRRG
ncbi:hypothetical protein CFB46_28915 [Burkholderia sp. HI2761]|nr:hypothetical protein [Burkholderia sp. BE24]OXJ24749.1 hypothetical protein CFB46_28915 [Burkholderia sp. HI2761]